jgi:lipase chaperone LimK
MGGHPRWWLAGIGLLALVAWRLAATPPSAEAPAIARVPGAVLPVVAVDRGRIDPAALASSSSAAAVDDAVAHVARLLQHGSLGGTEADGDWGRWSGDTLQPALSLRRRFDYLLTGLGEAQPAQLRAWVAAQVTALHGAAGAAQVLAVWDHYLALLQTAAGGRIDAADGGILRRALAELAAQRNAALGPAWAHAFFADETAETHAFLARREAHHAAASNSTDAAAFSVPGAADAMGLLTPPNPSLAPEAARRREADRVAVFGTEASARLRAEEAEWSAWELRLSAARERRQAIAADPQLSAPQRAQLQEADIARSFSGSELLRARGLLAADPR